MTYEQTIRDAVECHGIGLHSGVKANMRLLPASAGTGILFRRTDLDGFEIEATSRNVARVSYATSLMKKGVLISTTEHVLAALVGAGVDNAIIELDNLELPILDGSARPFMEMIDRVGLRRQRRPRTYYRIRRELSLVEGDKFISVSPGCGYTVSYTIDFAHPLIGRETYEVDLSDGQFRREIAAARTFGSTRDEAKMRSMGLIRGASLDNVVVLDDEAVVNGPLRYPDEFVRHKVLDLIGDLALLGRRIIGRVVANRAGHAMHTALVSRLLRDSSLWEETSEESPAVTASAIESTSASPV
ncbi:MAG TPA: UDP-3-O-acyl-N-acetylglucosamine deacetylase [Terriglobales bacterium]|nr:UDP-3-O-acyl-N-acetylglucosamine deacetylase [Terriglobales bacterium]